MKKLFETCYPLDQRCYEQYGLTEDILMENASLGMAKYIKKHFSSSHSVLIVAGFGNNGADGIVLARHLFGFCDVKLYLPFSVKSPMAKLQLERVQKMAVPMVEDLEEADILVDCLFGAGLSRPLDELTQALVSKMNKHEAFKLSCDIPSGIDTLGNPSPLAFKADVTITMGALKESLYTDMSKDFVGEVRCVDLGLSRAMYEMPTQTYLLETFDMLLPFRKRKNTHKGSFGHLAVIAGEKEGASLLSAMASLRFGVGLCTLVGESTSTLPYALMKDRKLPHNTTAIALGMGLGAKWEKLEEVVDASSPIILDADILHHDSITTFLEQKERTIVLTPHPKEFVTLYARVFREEITIQMLQSNRLAYARAFTKAYPHITLLLKGANSIIAQNAVCYINPHGTSKLSKGGSGDVLAGLIGALLAQGYKSLEATLHASLALSAGAKAFKGNDYAMLPTDLIDEVGRLEPLD
ncbi:MAG: NAD(P)H-hydrate dehydratase [Campylobacterota bacterium]|nr:NAD(P)H-hydrate dehydratase [Campylobacterota bacterium]